MQQLFGSFNWRKALIYVITSKSDPGDHVRCVLETSLEIIPNLFCYDTRHTLEQKGGNECRRFEPLLRALVTQWNRDLGQVKGHQCMIKTHRSVSKRQHSFTKFSSKVSLILTIILILGAMNNIFHITA